MNEFNRFSNFELFSDEKLGSVRTMEDETGKKWFVGQDVGECLGINSGLWDAYSNLIDEKAIKEENEKARKEKREPKIKPEDIERIRVSLKSLNLDSNEVQKGKGGARSIVLVSESGMYNMIINSRSPLKNDFQRWITNQVLPSIRENGAYVHNQEHLPEKDQAVIKAVEVDLSSRVEARVQALNERNAQLEQENTELSQKNNYLKTRRHDLRQDVNKLKEAKRDLKNDVRHLKKEIEKRNDDLSAYEDIIARTTLDLGKAYREIKKLKGEIPSNNKDETVYYVDPKSGLRFTSREVILEDEGLVEHLPEKEETPDKALVKGDANMKISKTTAVKQEQNVNIVDVTLLTKEEAQALPDEIRDIDKTWWLRSPGVDHGVAAKDDIHTKDANDYEASDIKKRLAEWTKEKGIKVNNTKIEPQKKTFAEMSGDERIEKALKNHEDRAKDTQSKDEPTKNGRSDNNGDPTNR